MITVATYPRFSELPRRERIYVLKRLTFKTGTMRRDLLRYDPAIAIAREIIPIGLIYLLDSDRRYKVRANGIGIYVNPKYRKQGIGRKLVARVRIYADYPRLRFWSNSKFFSSVLSDITVDGKIARSGR